MVDHFLPRKFQLKELPNSADELLKKYLFVTVQEKWIYNPDM